MQVPQLVRDATLVAESDLEIASLDSRNASGETVFTAVLEEEPTYAPSAVEFDDVVSRPRWGNDNFYFAPQFQMEADQMEGDQQAVLNAVASGTADRADSLIEEGGAIPAVREQGSQAADLPSVPDRTNASLLGQSSSAPTIVAAVPTGDRSQGALDEKMASMTTPSIISDEPFSDRSSALRSAIEYVSRSSGQARAAEKPPILGEGSNDARKTLREPPDLRSQSLAPADPLPLLPNQTVLLPQGESDAPFVVRKRQVVEPPLAPRQIASATEGHEGYKSARDSFAPPDNPSTTNVKENWSNQQSVAVSKSMSTDARAIPKVDFQVDQKLPASGDIPDYFEGREGKTPVGAQRSDDGVSNHGAAGGQSDPKAPTVSQMTTKLPEPDRPTKDSPAQEALRPPRDMPTETQKPSGAIAGPFSTTQVVYDRTQDLLSTKQFLVSEKTNFQTIDLPNGGPAFVGDVKSVPDFKGVELGSTKLEQPRALVPQLTDAVRSANNGVIEVKLAPEELGRVKLSLTPTEAGLAVTIIAERAETIDLIRRNIDLFANDLRQIGHQNLSFQFGHSGRQAGSNANPAKQDQFGDQLRNEQPGTGPPPISQTRMQDGQLDLRI